MTVIVMIFLMALAVMMVRNLELDRQLVSTMSAQEASLLENQTLVDKLAILETQILDLQQSLGGERERARCPAGAAAGGGCSDSRK